MNRRGVAVLAALTLAIVPAGCGGGDEGGESQPPAGGSGGGDPQQVFTSTCGGCHTLQAAGTSGSVGPSLDDVKPDRGQVLDAIAEGPGAMPENLLQGTDAEAVADYVAQNAG